MNLFSWGLVLLFFNINIGPLSLLPGWVGYLLLASAAEKIPQCRTFQDSLWLFKLGAVFSGICWLLRLAGVFELAVGLVFALVELLLKVLAAYQLNRGMAELEESTGLATETGRISACWLALVLGNAAVLLLTLVGSGAAIAALIVALVALVLYILAFQNSYHIWEAGRQTEE